MRLMRAILSFALVGTAAVGMLSCGGDTSKPDAGVSPADAGAKVCGEGTVHEQILNAPTSAQVVLKTPRHPPIGPEGLP